eukprot:gene8293-1564_t
MRAGLPVLPQLFQTHEVGSISDAASFLGLDLRQYILASEEAAGTTGEAAFTPILAVGSNAAPQVIQCVLEDFDVVYTPYLSSYGSCTATLEHSPGTKVEVFITYLNRELEERMHRTEGGYNLCQINSLKLHAGASLHQHSGSMLLDSVRLYNHALGNLKLAVGSDESCVALTEVAAANRAFPALTQTEMLGKLKSSLQPDADSELDEWVLNLIEDKAVRQGYLKSLAEMHLPFSYKETEVMIPNVGASRDLSTGAIHKRKKLRAF